MKLKSVVVLMSVLGLISWPAFATSQIQHHKSKKQMEENNRDEHINYKGEALSLACPKESVYGHIMDSMSQNVGRAKPTVDCRKPIQFAGGINFDYQMFGPLDLGFMGENNRRFALNDAYLNATGHVNEWVEAFLEISYSNIQADPLTSPLFGGSPFGGFEPKPGLYSEGYNLNTLTLQQGYVTLGKPEHFPLFLKLGKQFQDFGRYVIHPITRSMTQVMTETLQTSAELSFITGWMGMDFHGSGFAFSNTMGQVDAGAALFAEGHKHTNYGAQVGFGRVSDQLGFDVGIGYLNDMTGVNDIAYAVTLFHDGIASDTGEYVDRVNELTVYGTVNSGPFSFGAHYATALKHFNVLDLSTGDVADTDGAKPWSFDVGAAYGFEYWERSQNLYVMYQQSGEAANLFLPRTRWVAGYGVGLCKNTNLAIEYSHDRDYNEDDGGTGDSSNRVALRVGVQFG